MIKKLLSKHLIWNTLLGTKIGNKEASPNFYIISPLKGTNFSVLDKLIWIPLCKLYFKPFGRWKFSPSTYDFGRLSDETYTCYFN